MATGDPLRFTTWLAPGLPYDLFATIAEHVARRLGRPWVLTVESHLSGPLSPEDDRFAQGRTDIGFLCPPSYLWLVARPTPSVRLVPMAPVFDDERTRGRPHYVSDLVARVDSGIASFADLRGRRVGYNEKASLSGFVCLLSRLAADGLDLSFFGSLDEVGSHRRALDLILAGDLDAAAIDANVWRAWRSEGHADRSMLLSVDVLGPNPVQPIVVRASAGMALVEAVAEALTDPALPVALAPYGITGFATVSTADYEAIRPQVEQAFAVAQR